MPTTLYFVTLAASAAASPLIGMANRALSRGKSPYRGLLLPSLLALLTYTAFVLLWLTYSLPTALLFLFTLNLPLFVSLVVYLIVRAKRHNDLAQEYARRQKAQKPPVAASWKLRAALIGFSCASPLPVESQHEAILLLKAGTAPDKVADIYDCPLSELRRVEKAFDRYRAEQDREKTGVDYTVSSEQAAFFLQLMTNSTPKSLGCGEGLLWSTKSVRRLIFKASKADPSEKSVAAFLSSFSLLPTEEALAVTKTPAAHHWYDTEYRKIRLSALESGAVICWIYTFSPAHSALPRRSRVLYATGADFPPAFGLYRGSGGFADFLNKLAQEHPGRLYAVICSDYKDYKHLDSIHPDVTLFTLGEKAEIPEFA